MWESSIDHWDNSTVVYLENGLTLEDEKAEGITEWKVASKFQTGVLVIELIVIPKWFISANGQNYKWIRTLSVKAIVSAVVWVEVI